MLKYDLSLLDSGAAVAYHPDKETIAIFRSLWQIEKKLLTYSWLNPAVSQSDTKEF